MDAGKTPGEGEPLPFLIPLGPESPDDPAFSGGLQTPAPVRNAPCEPRSAEPKPAPKPPPPPDPNEPLVFLNAFGTPATQRPRTFDQSKAPPGKAPLGKAPPPAAEPPKAVLPPFDALLPAQGAPPPSPSAPRPAAGGLEAAILGDAPVENRPFQAPSPAPPAPKAASPFEPPKLDVPVPKLSGAPAGPKLFIDPGVGGFQVPGSGPPPGSFSVAGAPPPTPFQPVVGPPPAPPPVPSTGSPRAVPPLTAPPIVDRPRAVVPPSLSGSAPPPVPLRQPGDRGGISRQPLTAPPIRLPGSEPPKAKPFPIGGAPAPAGPRSAKPAAASGQLGFVELLESAGLLPFSTKQVLTFTRGASIPPAWLLVAHGLTWVFASFVIRASLSLGPASSLGTMAAPRLAVAVAIGLILSAAGLFLGAAIVHGLGRLSGGSGSFARGLEIVSLLAPMIPLSAALDPISLLWWVPGALTAYLLVRCLAGLYGAPIVQASIIVGTLAVLGGAGQYKTRQVLGSLRESAQTVGTLSTTAASAANAAAAANASAAAAANAAAAAANAAGASGAAWPGGKLTPEQAAMLQQMNQPGAPAQQPGKSGLSMLNAGEEKAGPQAGAAGSATGSPLGAQAPAGLPPFMMPLMSGFGKGPMTPEQQEQLRAQSAEAIRRAQQVLMDPRTADGMSPEERRQFQQLQGAAQALLRANSRGEKPSADETKNLMRSMQQMMQTAIQQRQQPPQKDPGTRRPRRKPAAPDEQ